jgi:DNA polymerase III sliding clamp (beta) subunit (PCNA family)
MSKIALPIAELKPALTGLGKVISKRPTLPVLNHIKIERSREGWIALTATDLDVFVTVRLEQPGHGEPIAMLVPYEQLLRTAKACSKNEDIFVGLGADNTGSIHGIGTHISEVEFNALPVSEFPEMPRIQGESIPLPEILRSSIREALQCASSNEQRMILNGVCLDVTKPKAHYVVATDGSHLFSSNSFNLPLKESLVIPNHKFLGCPSFNTDGEWQLKVGASAKDKRAPFQISSRRWTFTGWPREGVFPNWRQVVPDAKSAKITLTLEGPEALITTIERMPSHDSINHTIGLEWKTGKLQLLGKGTTEADWMKVPVEAQGTGSDITIFLNRNFLIKALEFGLCAIELSEPTSPIRFISDGRQMIVMPVRGQEAVAPKAEAKNEAKTEPAANPPAAQPERTTMPKPPQTNGTEKTSLETALEQVETVKGSYREAIRGLSDLTDTLKAIQKERKSTEKEVQTVRSTLRQLQSVKL